MLDKGLYVENLDIKLEKDRRKLISWLIEVERPLSIPSDALFIAINVLDHALLALKWDLRTRRDNLQLLGSTCLYMAINHIRPNEPADPDDFVYLSREKFTEDELLDMERELLIYLGVEALWVPTSYNFLTLFWPAMKLDSSMFLFAKHLLKYTLLDLNFLDYKPSAIAAAVCYAGRVMKGFRWTDEIAAFTKYNPILLNPIIKLMKNAEKKGDIIKETKLAKSNDYETIIKRNNQFLVTFF